MAAKKVALFVDVDGLHQDLRNLHNRSLDPKLLLEACQAHGDLVASAAIADWADLPEDVKSDFEALEVEVVEVARSVRSRETGGRRREVLRGVVDLEILARIVELLFTDGAPEVDRFVLGTSDDLASRIAAVVRARFNKEVVAIGVEGVSCDGLQAVLDGYECLPMPPIEPKDPESLSRLVPLLEDLEQRKRYLNFKYIRETVVRRLELAERSFDTAERLLSDAIACGVLLKQKIDDKYNPGQLFTAYSLNRESPYFQEWGSGEPAPDHDQLEQAEAEGEGEGQAAAPALPRLGGRGGGDGERAEKEREPRGRRRRRGRSDKERERDDSSNREREPAPASSGGAGGKRKRRRRRGGGGDDKIKLAAGGGGKRGRGGSRNHQQDRVGRMYEAPSRFLSDPQENESPPLADDDIDEDRILRARGDK